MSTDTASPRPAPDRRARNRERTHRALVDAAIELFHAEGFDAVPVERVADAAGVSPRTFFRYFATKEDVVLADYEAAFDVWEEETSTALPGETVLEVIRRGVHRIAVDYRARPDHWDRFFSLVTAEPALQRRLLVSRAHLLDRAARSLARLLGLGPTDPRPAALAAAAMTATDVAVRAWYASGQPRPRQEVVDEALDGLRQLDELLATVPVAQDASAAAGPGHPPPTT